MKSISKFWRRLRRSALDLPGDCHAVAATEFAMIVPIMLIAFFGTVEFCSAVAVDRKVTIMARTLSDLASQSIWVNNTATTNFFSAATAIMTPYSSATPAPLNSRLTELYIDPNTLVARVQWSVGQGMTARTAGSTVPIPSTLAVGGTYLLYSEVNYQYVPTVGYVLAPSGIALSDVAYTRPRKALCVLWSNTTTAPTGVPCPTT
jgi:Flp pilus assembly protein TadG